MLQNSHDPNLGSARIDATEVEELLRRMRALATVQPEQGKRGGEGRKVSVPIDLLRDLNGIALKWWGYAQTKYRDEGGIQWAGEMCAGQTYALASAILRKAAVAPAQPAEHPAPLGCLGCEAEAHPEMDGAAEWVGFHEPAFCKKPHPASGGEEK